MIVEIGAGLAVISSIGLSGVIAFHTLGKIREIKTNLQDARERAEALKDFLLEEKATNKRRQSSIKTLQFSLERLRDENAVLTCERDDARRAAEAATPIREKNGRFVSRSPRLPLNDVNTTASAA